MVRPQPPEDALTVADLFCGAGGFSEGFAQAGFRLKWAVDNWGPAVETYRKNHPGVEVLHGDILKIEPESCPSVDVLIGSPPCVHFSLANRGGNGDREKGLELVNRFLTFVDKLRPRYWVMENVPNLALLLQKEAEGESERTTANRMAGVPTLILDAASYGAPQHRKRMFSGRFPGPTTTHDGEGTPFVPLKRILTSLPNPTLRNYPLAGKLPDPLYPHLKVQESQLRDHFEDPRWRLSRYEQQRAKQQKMNNYVYGKMSYPDDIEKPSRTITATRTGGSRSTIVVPMGKRGVRTLTMREAACAQGFPISYQFWAKSMSDKDALVGNAVSPVVARAIADSILRDAGRALLANPLLDSSPPLPERVVVRIKRAHHFHVSRRFRGVVPIDMRPNHRVELDNRCAVGANSVRNGAVGASLRWTTRLYLGYATKYKAYELSREASVSLALAALYSVGVQGVGESTLSCLKDLSKLCRSNVPSAQVLQDRWSGRRATGRLPQYYCDRVGTVVDRHFPASAWGGTTVPSDVTNPVLNRCLFAKGTKAEEGQPLELSVRLLLSAVGMALLCSTINDGMPFPQEVLSEQGESIPLGARWAPRRLLTLDDSRWARTAVDSASSRAPKERASSRLGQTTDRANTQRRSARQRAP
ncbi:MAG: DNA cytosine methyltransferase [Nitrososphaerota archaeon]|nr:DNA cytosine methyltransferase [Nitrososphaerota archaeon]